jgi:hypothetical protein
MIDLTAACRYAVVAQSTLGPTMALPSSPTPLLHASMMSAGFPSSRRRDEDGCSARAINALLTYGIQLRIPTIRHGRCH